MISTPKPRLVQGVIRRGTSWAYVIRVRDPETGRTKPKWVGGFASEGDAKAARDEARVAARRGSYIDKSKITVGEWLDSWLETHGAAVKPSTLAGYKAHVQTRIKPVLGGVRLQDLSPAQITKFYHQLHAAGGRDGKPVSARTVHNVHRTLRKSLNDAVRVERILHSNPAERASLPRVPKSTTMQLWSGDELRRFLTTAFEHRLGAYYRLAAYTGARRGELLGLRWEDLDLENAQMTIAKTVAVIAGERVTGEPKSGHSRTIGLDAGTVLALREHRVRSEAERLECGRLWQGGDNGAVFTTASGGPLFPDTLTKLFTKLVTQAGLPPMRLHDLRHQHASMLLTAGVPVTEVSARLGHASPAITWTVYAHITQRQGSGLADVFAGAVEAAVSKTVSENQPLRSSHAA